MCGIAAILRKPTTYIPPGTVGSMTTDISHRGPDKELDRFLHIHDEPVGSLSIYAGYCIARLTREACGPVTLNGQGCDEILSGYWQSYFFHLRELGRHGQIIPLLRHFTGAAMGKGN